MTKRKRKILPGVKPESLIAVRPELCSGPGWANAQLWVYYWDAESQQIKTDAIQPENQTAGMMVLFRTLLEAHGAMMSEVVGEMSKGRG